MGDNGKQEWVQQVVRMAKAGRAGPGKAGKAAGRLRGTEARREAMQGSGTWTEEHMKTTVQTGDPTVGERRENDSKVGTRSELLEGEMLRRAKTLRAGWEKKAQMGVGKKGRGSWNIASTLTPCRQFPIGAVGSRKAERRSGTVRSCPGLWFQDKCQGLMKALRSGEGHGRWAVRKPSSHTHCLPA